MKHRPILAIAAIISAVAASSGSAQDTLWAPTDFDGAYVQIIDNARNGCWTNIGKVREYAEDQLTLAGFKVIQEPEYKTGIPRPLLRDNFTAYKLHVNASRQDSGMCIGYLNSSFWGAIAPGYDQRKLIEGQIGPPFVWSVWNKENLNSYMFDQVKGTIQKWVELGEKELIRE